MGASIVNLNNAVPAALASTINVTWQKGTQTGIDPVSGYPIFPVSAAVAYMVGDSGSGGTAGVVPPAPAGSAAAGKFLKADASFQPVVTSVGLAAPSSILTVSGSPVTSAGTITLTLATQTANQVWAGPTSGSPAAPTFRALVVADMPSGIGTVTSVGVAVPGILTVSGSPVTSAGTITLGLATQAANLIFAGPASGSAATPTFRALTAADLPSLLAPSVIRGTVSADTYGTSLTVNIPAASLAGDFAVLLCYNTGAVNNSPPAGWTTVTTGLHTGGTYVGFIASKILSSGDISTGNVSINITGPGFSPNSQAWAFMATFVGATGGIREFPNSFAGCPGSNTVTTSSAVVSSDVGLFFGTAAVPTGGVSDISISPGTVLQTNNDANAVGTLSSMTMPGGASTISYSATGGSTTTGMGIGIIVVEGTSTAVGSVTSVGLSMPGDFTVSGSPVTSAGTLTVTANTQSANTFKAGPASGSPAAPTYRAIVAADLPLATTGAFGAVKPDGTTITISGGVISSVGGSPLTTKGDLYGYSTVGARVPIGADTFVLTADSTQTLGLKWAASPAGFANPMTTAGDVITGGSGGTAQRLAIGSNGQVLAVVSGAPAWAPASGAPTAISTMPDWPPGSPGTLDDEFTAGSLSGSWSWINQGSATATLGNSFLTIYLPPDGTNNQHGIFQTLPSPTWQVQAQLSAQIVPANFPDIGLALTDGTKIMVFGYNSNTSSLGAGLGITTQATFTAGFTQITTPLFGANPLPSVYLQVEDDGTHLTFWYSFSGAAGSWVQHYQASRTAFFSGGATKIGFSGESANASNPAYICSNWIRRTI